MATNQTIFQISTFYGKDGVFSSDPKFFVSLEAAKEWIKNNVLLWSDLTGKVTTREDGLAWCVKYAPGDYYVYEITEHNLNG